MSELLYVNFKTNTLVDKAAYETNPDAVCVYVDSGNGLDEIYDEFKAFIERNTYIGFDIETSKWDGHNIKKNEGIDFQKDKLSVIQASDMKNTYVFNVNNLAPHQFMRFVDLLVTVAWVGHNIKFDTKFMMRDYKKRSHTLFCTEIAAKSIIAEPLRSYNFQTVMKEQADIHLSKEEQIANWGVMLPTYEMIGYAARDAYYSVQLMQILVEKLNGFKHLRTNNTESKYVKIFDVWHRLFHLEMETLVIFAEMETHGFMLDREATFYRHHEMEKIEMDKIKEIIDFLGGGKFNPRSPIQVMAKIAQLYPNEGRINEVGKFEYASQIESTDKDVLKFFINKGMPFIDKIYEFKRLTGQIQRLDEFTNLMDRNDRVYPDLRAWGTITSRTSCKKPNLQNIKNNLDPNSTAVNLKSLFIAPSGWKLGVVDFAQIQLVIIAAMTGDPLMREIIMNGPETGLDLHTATAAMVNNIDFKEVTKAQRKAAKPINFGISFGMGWRSFIEYALLQYDVIFTDKEAQLARERFLAAYKGIANWHRNVQASRRGSTYFCKSLYGREMIAFNFTDATNYPVQAAEALILKMSLILIKAELTKKNLMQHANLVNVVHDEVVYEMRDGYAEEIFEIICRNMSEAGRIILKGVLPVRVDGHIVTKWSEAK